MLFTRPVQKKVTFFLLRNKQGLRLDLCSFRESLFGLNLVQTHL